jgi:prepilin-type N-terminal cleavage/methylation domain-containing protein
MNASRRQFGFTLVELMIVIAIMSVLVTLIIPNFQPNSAAQLRATAEIVASDVAYARSMAVSRASSYTITFDLDSNAYGLKHTGSLAALNSLPTSPFHYDDANTERTTNLDELPGWGKAAQIAAVYATPESGPPNAVTSVQFASLGQTTRSDTTTIWLQVGQATSRRYISIEIDPVTGLESVGDLTDTMPVPISALD